MGIVNGVLRMVESVGDRVRSLAGIRRRWDCPGRDRDGRPVACGRKGWRILHDIADAGTLELQWERVEVSPTAYELKAGGETVAFLCGEVDLASVDCIRTAGGDWSVAYERQGPRANHIVVRTAQDGTEVACLDWRPLKSCLLRLPDGRQYQWSNVRWVPPQWALAMVDGATLITLSAEVLSSREHGAIMLSPDAVGLPDVSLLCTLAVYMFLLSTHKPAEWAT